MDEAAVAFRFALGTIFLLSGLAKVANRPEFERAVIEYRVLPAVLSRIVASLIPPLETTAGVFLLFGLATKVTALGVALLLLAFSAAVAVNLIRGRRIQCGCFGTLNQREISWLALLRNLALLSLTAIVVWRSPRVLALDAFFQPTSRVGVSSDGVAFLIAGSLGAFILSIVEESVNVWRLRRRFDPHVAGTR